MDKQFDNSDYVNPDHEYMCCNFKNKRIVAKKFNILMKYVLLTRNNKYNLEIIKKIIEEGKIDINEKNSKGWTALQLACINLYFSSTKTVKLLLKNGADINNQDNDGNTILHLMCNIKFYNKDVFHDIHFLIKYGANINIQNNFGKTPLHYLCESTTNYRSVCHLIKNHTNLNIMDGYGKTPMYIIVENYESIIHLHNIIELFLEYGANMDLKGFGNKSIQIILYEKCDLLLYQNLGYMWIYLKIFKKLYHKKIGKFPERNLFQDKKTLLISILFLIKNKIPKCVINYLIIPFVYS